MPDPLSIRLNTLFHVYIQGTVYIYMYLYVCIPLFVREYELNTICYYNIAVIEKVTGMAVLKEVTAISTKVTAVISYDESNGD